MMSKSSKLSIFQSIICTCLIVILAAAVLGNYSPRTHIYILKPSCLP